MPPEIITLKDFVRESLIELINGVAEAQANLPQGAHVNPAGTYFHEGRPIYYEGKAANGHYGTVVEFDVAVTATEKGGSTGGVGVFFAGITAGGRADKGSEEITANRMKFSVPVFYSVGK